MGSGLGLLGNAIQSRTGGEVNYFGVELAYKSSRASSGNGLIGIQADIGMLPFASNSFDGIVSTDVLEHVLDSGSVAEEMFRVLKPEAKAFVVIADPIEPRFGNVQDHINRNNGPTNVDYWEELFEKKGFVILRQEAKKYRDSDWRNIFNLPFLVKIRDCPGFACAFNPINRPGVYIIRKPKV